jgi:hypothetical protein
MNVPMPPARQSRIELSKALYAIVVVLLHTLVSGVIIACMWLMERFVLLLWGGNEPRIFGVHLHVIMLTGEVAVLLTFLAVAAISAAKAFWR